MQDKHVKIYKESRILKIVLIPCPATGTALVLVSLAWSWLPHSLSHDYLF